MRAAQRALLAVAALSFACGCASQPGARSDPRDPWEHLNRATFRFNDRLDRAVLKPVARGYRRVTPHVVRVGVSNFLNNVSYPTVMVNELLQGRFTPFVRDTGRLFINTTIGIGGLFDPATPMGFEKNDRDLGQTLGVWGVSSGPYLVIPLLGPSDVRDGFGRAGDVLSDPRTYIRSNYWSYGLWAVGFIDTRAQLLEVEGALEGAYDPYAFVRNAYLQNREFKVRGGNSHAQEDEEKKMLEESGIDSSPEAPAQRAAPAQAPPTPPPATPPATPPK